MPYTGSKPVKFTNTLDVLRKNQVTVEEPTKLQMPEKVQESFQANQNTSPLNASMVYSTPYQDVQTPQSSPLIKSNPPALYKNTSPDNGEQPNYSLNNQAIQNVEPSLDMTDFNDSINEFEEQRKTMLSQQENMNVPRTFQQESPSSVNIAKQVPVSLKVCESFPQQNIQNNIQPSIPQTVQEINQRNYATKDADASKGNVQGNTPFVPEPKMTLNEKRNISPSRMKVTISARVEKPNDDINLSKVRENSVPRQQSLQKDFDVNNGQSRSVFSEGRLDQKSFDKDDEELIDINQPSTVKTVRYRPPSPSGVTPVRFTPTPKQVNSKSDNSKFPPSLPNLNTASQPINKPFSGPHQPLATPVCSPIIANSYQKNCFHQPQKSISSPSTNQYGLQKNVQDQNQTYYQYQDKEAKEKLCELPTAEPKMSNAPSRNVSDSGISDSTTPEPDEIAGKIITNQMQKIEAQMKKILESENSPPIKAAEPPPLFIIEQSSQPIIEKNRNSTISNPHVPAPSKYSASQPINESKRNNIVNNQHVPAPLNHAASQPINDSKINNIVSNGLDPAPSNYAAIQPINESKRNSIASIGLDPAPSNYSTMSGYSTCSEEELKFEEPNTDTLIKTAPFEIMEEFEEAPAEFDLGISSYSIAHPIENEEMDKTPVPEVYDSDNYSTLTSTLGRNKDSTSSYRVTTPSGESKQQAQPKAPTNEPKYVNEDKTCIPNNTGHFANITPMNSPFFQPPFQMINPMAPMPAMPAMPTMFDPLPSMFDSAFTNKDFFNSPFPSMPASVPYAKEEESLKAKSPSAERIIPIQIVHTSSGLQNGQTSEVK